MKKKNTIILSCIFIFFLHSCSGLSDAKKVLTNQKTRTTDEFLVKKRKPLTLPPDFTTIPEPRSIQKSKKNVDKNIESILEVTEETIKSNKKSVSSVEQSIINEIRKWKKIIK